MKNQSKPFPLALFCGGELIGVMFAALAGIRAGMRVELSNVARVPMPQAGWDVPIAYLDYHRFFLAFGLCLLVLTALWLAVCLWVTRRAPVSSAGAGRRIFRAACLAAAVVWGLVCGGCLPLWEYAVLLAEGSRVLDTAAFPAAFHLPSAALGAVWAAAGLALIGRGMRPRTAG